MRRREASTYCTVVYWEAMVRRREAILMKMFLKRSTNRLVRGEYWDQKRTNFQLTTKVILFLENIIKQ